ncbi:DEAD/DEAH box helicase [Brevibacillus migulae]|uniref:DEAD/DEAH box helicase n=1 Tax=Brevibacillus migulae TaxID=1644114 RepID=UPI00106DF05C|nr:helicase-related protein [Brevibacillus migulae]
MPEYLLYVKEENRTRQAYITPCFEVDRHFWEQEDGRRLHIIGKSPSLAIAFMLREQVNQRLAHDAGIDSLKQLAHTAVRESSVLYGRAVEETKDWFQFSPSGGLEEKGRNDHVAADLPIEADRLRRILSGRALLWEEIVYLWMQHGGDESVLLRLIQWLVLEGKAVLLPGIRLVLKKGLWRNRLLAVCERCGEADSIHLAYCYRCEQGCGYCAACIQMGQSKCCARYVCVAGELDTAISRAGHPFASGHESSEKPALLEWEGTYTPWQAEAAERARQFVAAQDSSSESFLLWAVCGAGKTELLFPSIADMLASGKKVLVATPRKDVVLELAPRLQRVFPRVKVIAVHGASGEKWEEADVVVSTTHQVMRFYRRFPLVVVDEADAFPYHGNPMLYRAVQRAVALGGKQLYLTATPPKKLRKALVPARFGLYAPYSPTHTMLPQRYHGHPLPVPKQMIVAGLQQKLRRNQPLGAFLEQVRHSLTDDRRVFVFVPRVNDVEEMTQYLTYFLPDCHGRIAGVHAADPLRDEKVKAFRDRQLSLLVTTTILERGVTIPQSDVIVWGADNAVFDQASLVQIAGRVGRSADSPGGTILFLVEKQAEAPREAIREIKRMNRLAQRLRGNQHAG